MLLITKVASDLIYPLGLFFAFVALAGVMRLVGLRKLALGTLIAATVALWVVSTPVFAIWSIAGLEAEYPPVPMSETPQADVAILLGGTTAPAAPPRQRPDLQEASDRIVQAADLYRAGKVSAIIASGGSLPWESAGGPEAERMASLLVDLGVPKDAILLETESRTTYENALEVAKLFEEHDFKSALLVTSASHMPRAMAVFRKAGLPVTASSTDVVAAGSVGGTLLDWLPDPEALGTTQRAEKERVGYFVYWLRGWL